MKPAQVRPEGLPIDEIMPDILRVLSQENRLVLAAPPGAGKTTKVALALAGLGGRTGITDARILLLEPRRVAARMAADRMAALLGEEVGQTIGLSTRFDRKLSARTRIEVITDGLLTRRIMADQDLGGVGALIFDEFHERRLNADLGLALALDIQAVLREDLRILIMSATLDTQAVSQAIAAPVLESAGRMYPVETRYLGRSGLRVEDRMPSVIRQVLHEEPGSVLVFLPGAREITRTAEALQDVAGDVIVAPLYGALPPAQQDLAVSPAPHGMRKVVLATDIAESSLTIPGVRIVIDSGLSRVAQEAPDGGMARLVTVPASRASVDQRRGRAGRTSPGVCYRLWDEAATRGLTASPVPEILTSDLSGLALALAEWGVPDAGSLTWLDRPPSGRLAAARRLLAGLGALDGEGRLTPKGRQMSQLALPPRLSALVAGAPEGGQKVLAAEIAALISEPGTGGDSRDLRVRLSRFRSDGGARAAALRRQARAWAGTPAEPDLAGAGRLLAMAWPDRVARRRPDGSGQYVMVSGGAAALPPTDPLAGSEWLVIAEAGGGSRLASIQLAQPLSEQEALAALTVTGEERASFDARTGRFTARRITRAGAIILSESMLPRPSPEAAGRVLLETVREQGFGAIGAEEVVQETINRLRMLSGAGLVAMPDADAEGLAGSAEAWLPALLERKGACVPGPDEVRAALIGSLDWAVQEALRREAPLSLELPSGQTVRINWLDPRAPLVAARAQAFFGLDAHPMLAAGRIAVTVELLSPGMKPAASTRDLPAFWSGGYRDMVKDMRGRYPKHDWPDDPARAAAHEGRTRRRLQGTGR